MSKSNPMSQKPTRTRYPKRQGRYRSKLEASTAKALKQRGIDFSYEDVRVPWLIQRHYVVDFVLPNGIIVETKGRFLPSDRRKHIEIRRQHPTLDIRFVFSNSKATLYKGSKTTYAQWCDKRDFLYADKNIPPEWLKEKPNEESLTALASFKPTDGRTR